MQNITQKQFIDTMINNKSLRIGITKKAISTEKIKDFVNNTNFENAPFRTCVKYSNGLRFSDYSRLQLTKRKFQQINADKYIVLVCITEELLDFGSEMVKYTQYIYYLIS